VEVVPAEVSPGTDRSAASPDSSSDSTPSSRDTPPGLGSVSSPPPGSLHRAPGCEAQAEGEGEGEGTGAQQSQSVIGKVGTRVRKMEA